MRNLIEQPKITQFERFILPLQPVLLYSVVGNCCKVPLAIGLPKDLYFCDQLPPARNILETAYNPLQLINIKANPFSVTVSDFLLCFSVVLKWPELEDHKISIFIQPRQLYCPPSLAYCFCRFAVSLSPRLEWTLESFIICLVCFYGFSKTSAFQGMGGFNIYSYI